MATFQSNPFSGFYKRILQFGHSGNNGTPTSTTSIQAGDGVATSISLSDDTFHVRPINDDSTAAVSVQTNGGVRVLEIDTTNSIVKAGASQANALTLFKEMGLYDFSPLAGYHYPLIANTMFIPSGATAFAGDSDWGNGTDPATTLDVSGLTAQENAVAVYWYLENNITLDAVRYIATADGSATLNLHLVAYTLDTSSAHGDLSSGVIHAYSTAISATNSTIKTGTFTFIEENIDAGKIVIGFVENATDTSDVSLSLQIKYHIR